jgi:phosphoglycolate phosphatase
MSNMPPQPGPAEPGPAEPGPSQSQPTQSQPAQSQPSQSQPSQSQPSQSQPSQSEPSQSEPTPSKPRVKLACVDMAGTVMRDDGIVIDAFASALHSVGVDGPRFEEAMAYAHKTMGLSKRVVFKAQLGHDDLVEQALAAFDAAIEAAIGQGRVSELPGARGALAALRSGGAQVCLTTGFTDKVQRAVIEHLGWDEVTDFFIAPSETVRGRPYPDMVLCAVLRAGIDDVREVGVVGDTANDLWSGYRAGASVVAGVLTGSHDRAELERAPHTHILASIVDFPPLVVG